MLTIEGLDFDLFSPFSSFHSVILVHSPLRLLHVAAKEVMRFPPRDVKILGLDSKHNLVDCVLRLTAIFSL